MGFGHIFVKAESATVQTVLDRYLEERGMPRIEMTSERHPRKMKEVHETDLRLFWISPALGGWTGLFEYRYYNNELRERWGYTDEQLAPWLSKELDVPVYRMEVLDAQGFWMYARYEKGEEKEGRAYQDDVTQRTADPQHPRYELNRIIEREGIRNISLGYENIPGPMVALVENCNFWKDGIEGREGFVHRAYQAKDLVAAAARREEEGKNAHH